MKLRGHIQNSYIHASVSDLRIYIYSHVQSVYSACRKIGGPIVVKYESLTHT